MCGGCRRRAGAKGRQSRARLREGGETTRRQTFCQHARCLPCRAFAAVLPTQMPQPGPHTALGGGRGWGRAPQRQRAACHLFSFLPLAFPTPFFQSLTRPGRRHRGARQQGDRRQREAGHDNCGGGGSAEMCVSRGRKKEKNDFRVVSIFRSFPFFILPALHHLAWLGWQPPAASSIKLALGPPPTLNDLFFASFVGWLRLKKGVRWPDAATGPPSLVPLVAGQPHKFAPRHVPSSRCGLV